MSLCVSEAKCHDEQFNLLDLLIFIIVTLKCQIHFNWQLSLKLEAKFILIYYIWQINSGPSELDFFF